MKGNYECNDQSFINKDILQGKNFTATWIDYRKVFDSPLHLWIVERIMLSGVYTTNKFIRKCMKT